MSFHNSASANKAVRGKICEETWKIVHFYHNYHRVFNTEGGKKVIKALEEGQGKRTQTLDLSCENRDGAMWNEKKEIRV